ncbi:hypothetical protein BFO_0613 [Tannerella forsythia 92A2]|uniref:Uncharacterized protein n=1 Tax=Tannerella forsythia (strain ATCC 43037 / JCM 10827 / CCUG 21028 A / KCTC 5666 / FDC 338) TaxID=203275 RepID=G8UM10_TANFA|nr:hypothetical protein BFO_0613 [Tannerella forsythia 92A2]
MWISPAVPLGFYVRCDARKFSPVYKFRYIRTRENLHTKIILKMYLIENKEVTSLYKLNG